MSHAAASPSWGRPAAQETGKKQRAVASEPVAILGGHRAPLSFPALFELSV